MAVTKKETIKYDLAEMSFERKGHVFKVTILDDIIKMDIGLQDIVRQAVLYAVQKKAVDAIASMGGNEYTDQERQDVMQNIVNAINNGDWRVRSASKETVSKATFAKVFNIAELKMLAKIAPQVLTAEQKTMLEWADSKEQDNYLEQHPEIKKFVDALKAEEEKTDEAPAEPETTEEETN